MSAEWLAGNIAAHWVQSGILAASALMAMRLLLLREPHARLMALHVTLVAILLLPAVQPWSPGPPERLAASGVATIDVPASPAAPLAGVPAAAISGFEPQLFVLVLAAAGIAIRLIWLLYGVVRLARFSHSASVIEPPDEAWDLESELRVSARYIQQTSGRGPWTFGLLRPTIALPAGFESLAADFQRSVICHELIHIKRRDMAVAFCEELAVAALWFHPWIWLLRARIRVAREQAVDSRVVALLGNREEYVRCLIDMAGHDIAPHFSQAGAGMLRPRELRARIDAILEEVHMSRARLVFAALSFMIVMTATGLIAASAMPLRSAALVDIAPAIVMAPAMAQAPTQTRIKLEPVGSLPITLSFKDASLRAVLTFIEFATSIIFTGDSALLDGADPVTIKATIDATSTVETLLDTLLTPNGLIYTTTGPRTVVITSSPLVKAAREIRDQAANPDASGTYLIGPGMEPPKKMKDVPPSYPALAQAARAQGAVIMEVRVDEQGMVSDVRTLRSIPLLDQAAIDAVKQWQYTPTLLNGVAVPVRMTVTVNFSLRPREWLRLTMPDGNLADLGIDQPSQLYLPGGRFRLVPSRAEGERDLKVSLYGKEEAHLGDVILEPDGPVVQSPTTPSFGIRLIVVP